MTTTPLVSVLMTSYNREKYIGQAIESVLASDYANLELIIVDDISKDNTVAIAKEYASRDPRVKVFINEKNLGDYPNRNQAAAYASGKYLKYVDSDDFIYPWGLSLLVRMMEQYPESGFGLCSLLQYVKKPYPFLLQPREAYEYNYQKQEIFHKAPLSAIFKTEAFRKVGGFSALRMVGDFEMWHKMALQFPVVLMPDGIVWYREHEEQEMSSFDKFARKYDEIMLQYLTHPQCPLSRTEVRDILIKKRRNLLRSMLNNLTRFRVSGATANWKSRRFFGAALNNLLPK